MSIWRASDDSIRWLVVIGLVGILNAVWDLYEQGPGNLLWAQSISFAIACLVAAPLEDPSRRRLPWQQRLRTPNGLLASAAFVVFIAIFLWRIAHR